MKEPPNVLIYILFSDSLSVNCEIMTVLKFDDPLAVWCDSEENCPPLSPIRDPVSVQTHFLLKGIRVSLLQLQTVHYATSFKALSFNLSM